jgi:4-diphosphocytidyl-2-C-methyl-D-erythritol kinase
MPTTVRSHAKINLGLYIGAPRTDGFHSLATVYQTLELHDLVTVTAHLAPTTSISLTSNDTRVPIDNRNTAWKMVSLALDSLGAPAEVAIHIEKRLPIQGGLGAGSANAVAALIALEAELNRRNPGKNPGAPSIGRTLSDGWESTKIDKTGAPGLDSETWAPPTVFAVAPGLEALKVSA